MSNNEYLQILYRALSSPIGIELPTSDITRCRAKLYSARVAAKDPSLNFLEFRASPTGQSILIVKGNKSDA